MPAAPLFSGADLLARSATSLLPVVVFLASLILLDSYKLVSARAVLRAIAAGLLAALAGWLLNTIAWRLLGWPLTLYSRYAAPLLEEALKALYLVWLFRSRRIGFLVDAAILGFAVGAGFAIMENLAYLGALQGAGPFVWVMRGFGTAVMHGGATALLAVVAQGLIERGDDGGRGGPTAVALLAGLAPAVAIHSLYNHFLLPPAWSALALVGGMPLVMLAVFWRSERALSRWLGVGFDADARLLEMIGSGRIEQTRLGRYLLNLRARFPGEVVADMLCLLRLHLELSIHAKGLLLMREAGFDPPPAPDTSERFVELRYLERSLGPTGRRAVAPMLRWSRRELWQLHMLGRG